MIGIFVNYRLRNMSELSADVVEGIPMAILQHIQTQRDQLAESEVKVADAILAEPHLLEHYTITSLAQHAGTSTSAVLRFCHSLGYAGFKDFRYELIAELQQPGDMPSDEQDTLCTLAHALAQAISHLADLDRAVLEDFAAQIVASSCVFCVGIHRSSLPAAKLRMDLEDLGILAISLDSAVHATHVANIVDKQNCVVIFSESGSQTSYRPALDAGLMETSRSWVITSNPRPQLAAHAGHTVVLPSAKRAGALSADEHPVAMAFVELLTSLVRSRLQLQPTKNSRS